jgi:hypothetical protein
VAPLLAPLALILVHGVVRAHARSFPFVFFLGSIRFWSKILPLLVVLSLVDAINTTIVALDPLFLLDTHSYELLECPLVIHGVVVHLKGFELLDIGGQIKGLQSSSNIAHPQNMISHTITGVLLRNETFDNNAHICL